jgi:prepilin-type N-terminal cleavage/methylation domain-containing protein
MTTSEERYDARKRETGFTLVEIMVALFILTIGILAIATMQNSSLLGTARSNSVTQATNIAMDRMERLMASTFDVLNALNKGTDYDNSYFPAAAPTDGLANEDITFQVVDGPVFDDSNPPQPTTLTITVTIQPRGMKSIILTGIKTQL